MVVVEAGEGAAERLLAAIRAADIASLIVRAPADGALTAAEVAPLVAVAQRAQIAVLVEGDARLARTVKADGVHIPVSETAQASFAEAREIAGGRALIGLDAGRSRHDAMTAGEAGADYVGFGIPAFVKDRETAIERRLELIAWWAEIFEVPSVALDVATPDEAAALARAGADFIAFSIAPATSPADASERTCAFAAAIAPLETGN